MTQPWQLHDGRELERKFFKKKWLLMFDLLEKWRGNIKLCKVFLCLLDRKSMVVKKCITKEDALWKYYKLTSTTNYDTKCSFYGHVQIIVKTLFSKHTNFSSYFHSYQTTSKSSYSQQSFFSLSIIQLYFILVYFQNQPDHRYLIKINRSVKDNWK